MKLKSVVLIVLALLFSDAKADEPKSSGKGKPQIRVPLNVKTTYFVYTNPKLIRKYVEDRLESEIERLNKGKAKLRGKARKRAVVRSKTLKRELASFRKKNIVPKSLRKSVSEQGIGFVDTGKDLHWVRVVTIINDKEFTATIGHQWVTSRITSRNYGQAITRQTFAGFTRTNIEGVKPFRFIGFDTSRVRKNNAYRLSGFFKTTATTVEPFVPDAK